ncbi:LOW QUALITY PROTEIN: hypothetical protein PHMEG_00022118 [Phytophthora megakarya]|uniref:Uncharacterized protein n=1 Tax=Phytophthora megakarya TaxID=4795 RepID=A0A225VK81_9STRA|nr:LOW QUALITY PROTEIN: hypothetical protein PHMEG_00022118 [Phytophthora megakarya]
MSDYGRPTRPSPESIRRTPLRPDGIRLQSKQDPSSCGPHACMGYPRLDVLIRIASESVRVSLISAFPTQIRFSNKHPSSSTRVNVLRKNIRKEQDSLRCIVVDADSIKIWLEIFQVSSTKMMPTRVYQGV